MHTITLALAFAAAVCGTESDQGGKRDPFASYSDEWIHCFNSPLQQTALEAIKLEAVVADVASPRAIVTLPDGTSHVIRVGTLVGPNFGEVTAIRRGIVEVRERFRRTWDGGLEVRRTSLKF